MLIRLFCIFLILSIGFNLDAQRKSKSHRAKKLNTIYIPVDIYESHKELDQKITDDFRIQLKYWKEQEAVNKTKHSLGLVLRHDWQLWNGSRLSKYFNSVGIFNANDMSEIIIKTYHRYLNDKPLLIAELVKEHIQKWENLKGIDLEKKEE